MKASLEENARLSPGLMVRLAVAVVVRPWLWWVAIRCALRFAPNRWWARPPFLPWPDAGYMRFRTQTVYGASGRPEVRELVEYLDWLRRAPE